MPQQLSRLFTEHPRDTGETYMEHLLFTVRMGTRIGVTALFLLVHGVFPFLFTRTASQRMENIWAVLKERKQKSQQLRAGAPCEAAADIDFCI